MCIYHYKNKVIVTLFQWWPVVTPHLFHKCTCYTDFGQNFALNSPVPQMPHYDSYMIYFYMYYQNGCWHVFKQEQLKLTFFFAQQPPIWHPPSWSAMFKKDLIDYPLIALIAQSVSFFLTVNT